MLQQSGDNDTPKNIVLFYNYPKLVLLNYLCPAFEGDEKPKGDPWKSKFFCWGGLTKGVEGGQEPSKTLHHLFIQQKNKIQNLDADN